MLPALYIFQSSKMRQTMHTHSVFKYHIRLKVLQMTTQKKKQTETKQLKLHTFVVHAIY